MNKLEFLTQLRIDSSAEYDITDLCGNKWKPHNSSKLIGAPDPFGGKNAIPFFRIGGIDMLTDNDNKLYEANTQHTIAFWYYHDLNSYRNSGDDFWLSWGQVHNTTTLWSYQYYNNCIDSYRNRRVLYAPTNVPLKEWFYTEVSCDNGLFRVFVNGKKIYENKIDTTLNTLRHSTTVFPTIGAWNSELDDGLCGYIYDFCIIKGVWHTEDYVLPNKYIQLSKQGLLVSNEPLNLLDKTSVNGFSIEGIEPSNTTRKIAFRVDDVWNRIGTDGALVPLSTQEITADSIKNEGNTVAELSALTTVSGMAGKLVYPAVALHASEEATVMPTFGMTVNALIDTIVNVYSFTDYSQEYAISDGEDVPVVSVVAEVETKGNGTVAITARIKQNGEWSEYMSLNAVQMKRASAIQLKAVYTVQNTDGSDSAKISGVVIKYNTAGAVTSNATTEIVTVTQKFTNDLTYVHAYCKHKELIDAEINAYCSIRKQPQKRVQYQVGNGTGALKTYTLPDSGLNQDTLAVYVDGKFISDFGYNTETSEITLTADKDAVVSASYEYGWEMSDWLPMEQGASQINDSGNYTTEYTYTIPSHDGIFTVTAVKFELARPEGHVDNETIGTGTGRRQMIRLPHIARKETIVCNGKWSYDYDNQRLTIIAPENEPIVISYDWIAESPKVYSIAAGWAD